MKKVVSIAVVMIMCVGLMAACGGSNPKHDEIQTLLDEVKTEYDNFVALVEEAGGESADALKSMGEQLKSAFDMIEQGIKDGELKKMAEEELDEVISVLKTLKDQLLDGQKQIKALQD